MRTVKIGSVTMAAGSGDSAVTVTLGETISESKYMVILNGDSLMWQGSTGAIQGGAYIKSKSSTSFVIARNNPAANVEAFNVGYQVIAFD